MNIMFIGGGGTDAPGIRWNGKKFVPVPGWDPNAITELAHAVSIIAEAGRLKTPRLAEAAAKSVAKLVEKELGAHLGAGDVLVIR